MTAAEAKRITLINQEKRIEERRAVSEKQYRDIMIMIKNMGNKGDDHVVFHDKIYSENKLILNELGYFITSQGVNQFKISW